MRAILEEPLPNISLFIFFWHQRCLSQVSHAFSSNIDDFTLMSTDEEILEDMDKEDMVIFHCMVLVDCIGDFSYNVSHTTSIQNFDQLHLGGVWWIYISISSYKSDPSMVYKWSLISSLEIRFRVWFFFCFQFFISRSKCRVFRVRV